MRSTLPSAVLASLLLATPALAQTTETGEITVGDTATRIARGAGIIVPVTIACSAESVPTSTSVSLSVLQRHRRQIVSSLGAASTPLPCGPTPTAVEVVAPANTLPFRLGTALVQANLFACNADFSACVSDTSVEEITVVRPE